MLYKHNDTSHSYYIITEDGKVQLSNTHNKLAYYLSRSYSAVEVNQFADRIRLCE
jgi:hypothetical protein